MLNDRTSTLSLLTTRRSCRPRDLVEPGPSEAELRQILVVASRVPDHGKLNPWRFVHIPRSARAAFAALLDEAYRAENPNPGRLELEANERFAHQAPELIVPIFSPKESKIPEWEQELSCGAACMNLIVATAALGYCAGWVTGWATYSDRVRDAFASPRERLTGFVFIGTPGIALEERQRPAFDEVVSQWTGA